MSAQASTHAHAAYNPNRLFILSCISLIAAAFVFSIRGEVLPEIQKAFNLTDEARNGAAGAAFLGFALTVFIGSPACDWVGMGRLLWLAGILHVTGTLATIFAGDIGGAGNAYAVLWGSMFTVGLAHGLVEAVINPLAATIYPNDKTHKLNVLHAWWPGGLVVGGLIAVGIGQLGFDWRVKLAVILVPSLLYIAMLIGQKFPPTERMASSVSNADMFKEALRPLFLLILFSMLLTASTELAPNQLLGTLSEKVGFPGTLILTYVSALMFGLRFFAGPVAHKLSPIGLMWGSSALAGVGLFLLSQANNPAMALLSATIFGLGVCYMWPTMLGITSELFPKGGAFLLGLMGTFGNIAIYFVLPELGKISDTAAAKYVAQGMEKAAASAAAAPEAFRTMAFVPILLLVTFGIAYLMIRARGGYHAIVKNEAIALGQADPADFSTEAVLETDVAAARQS